VRRKRRVERALGEGREGREGRERRREAESK